MPNVTLIPPGATPYFGPFPQGSVQFVVAGVPFQYTGQGSGYVVPQGAPPYQQSFQGGIAGSIPAPGQVLTSDQLGAYYPSGTFQGTPGGSLGTLQYALGNGQPGTNGWFFPPQAVAQPTPSMTLGTQAGQSNFLGGGNSGGGGSSSSLISALLVAAPIVATFQAAAAFAATTFGAAGSYANVATALTLLMFGEHDFGVAEGILGNQALYGSLIGGGGLNIGNIGSLNAGAASGALVTATAPATIVATLAETTNGPIAASATALVNAFQAWVTATAGLNGSLGGTSGIGLALLLSSSALPQSVALGALTLGPAIAAFGLATAACITALAAAAAYGDIKAAMIAYCTALGAYLAALSQSITLSAINL